ncbi:pilus assembly protein TadB [Polymorphobacter multimanifer]|uniref:Tight adherence protein B n=1 Tax=Polymorphobacter multimanifer TaxID=1070431 RepID=A0A841L1A0_9SPHN|nr:type II secretion system F family protein [Polymorphobacter multimanifer]MBB6226599.1 tight adherence protein B [Polymorphobacter multimanifer]GGI88459.1 pilus assembly protein TadB [Polymorphobacter multimanifer]
MDALLDAEFGIYLAVFLAVVLLVEGIFLFYRDIVGPRQRVSRRMELLSQGASNAEIMESLRRQMPDNTNALLPSLMEFVETRMTQAGMRMRSATMATIMMVTTLTVGIIFPIIGGISGQLTSPLAFILVIVFAIAIGVVLPMSYINIQAVKRMRLFEKQFPIGLDIFVRGLRAGYPVPSALELLVSEVPDPLSSEFGLVLAEMNYGYNLRDALSNLADRVRTQDMQMFVVSVAIQSETGGSLADILEGLSRVIRDRAQMVLKVNALASEGKMTGTLLTALPLLTFAFMFATQPRFYLDVIDDPWFLPGVVGMAVMYFLGVFIMRKLITIKV